MREGALREWRIDPRELGLPLAAEAELVGGDPAANARVVRDVLGGRARGGPRTAVALNAAAALYVAGRARDLAEGVRAATDGLDAGVGLDALERLRRASEAA